MPLHEPPLQKCGTGHWLTEPCPKGECDLLVFEQDRVVFKTPKNRIDVIREGSLPPQTVEMSVHHDPEKFGEPIRTLPDAEAAIEEVQKSALSPAEKQKRYRERQKAKVHDPPKSPT